MRPRPIVLVAALLAAFALAGCGSSEGGSAAGRTTTSLRASSSAPADGADRYAPTQLPVSGDDVLTFRPVLGSDTCATSKAGPTDAGTVPDRDGTICYRLGPIGGTAADIETAEPTQDSEDQNRWTVLVTPTQAGAKRLNLLFDHCAAADASCPPPSGRGPGSGPGSIAIVFQGEVVSAPSVNASGIASQPFVISGEFTEQEAQALADLVNS